MCIYCIYIFNIIIIYNIITYIYYTSMTLHHNISIFNITIVTYAIAVQL